MLLAEVRQGRITDFPRIIPIIEAHSDLFGVQTKRRIVQLASKVLEEQPKNPPVYLSWLDSAPVGFVTYSYSRDDPTMVELVCQIIKRGLQGQGLGTQLLTTSFQHLQQQGVNQITLQLDPSRMPSALRFYRKHGFKPYFTDSYTGSSDELQTLLCKLKQPAVSANTSQSATIAR